MNHALAYGKPERLVDIKASEHIKIGILVRHSASGECLDVSHMVDVIFFVHLYAHDSLQLLQLRQAKRPNKRKSFHKIHFVRYI